MRVNVFVDVYKVLFLIVLCGKDQTGTEEPDEKRGLAKCERGTYLKTFL